MKIGTLITMKTSLLVALPFTNLPLAAREPKGAWFTCDFEQPDWQARWDMGNPNLPRNLAIVPHRTTGASKPHYGPDIRRR